MKKRGSNITDSGDNLVSVKSTLIQDGGSMVLRDRRSNYKSTVGI